MSIPFEVYTDHYALQWLKTMRTGSALLHRWSAALEEYDFTVKHRHGKSQTHVDGLSRLPVDPPPPEDTLLQVCVLNDEDEANRIAVSFIPPPTSVATRCGSSFATGIHTRPAAASAWRPPRAVPNVNWAPTTATARRRLELYSLKALGICCQLTLWDRSLRITATSSRSSS